MIYDAILYNMMHERLYYQKISDLLKLENDST